MCPSRTSCQETSAPVRRSCSAICRLLARFSSALPHPNAIVATPGAARFAASTVATKPVTSGQNSKPDSCGSSSGVKNDPLCRNSPAKTPGAVHDACSAASAPRLWPISTGSVRLGHASASIGTTWSTSVVAYAGLAA